QADKDASDVRSTRDAPKEVRAGTARGRLRSCCLLGSGQPLAPSALQVPELAAQLELARRDARLGGAQAALQVLELALKIVRGAAGLEPDRTPERLLLAAGVQALRPALEHQRRDQVAEHRRH